MLDAKQRNRKINHIIESTIHDFCKVLGCSNFTNKNEVIMAQLDGADLCYIYPEFNNNNYEININCMVYSELTISKTTKLKEVYRSNEIAEYLEGTKASLWFLDDSRLIMSSIERLKYGEYAILKSKLPLGIYANVMNVRKLKDKLEGLLVELEQISVN